MTHHHCHVIGAAPRCPRQSRNLPEAKRLVQAVCSFRLLDTAKMLRGATILACLLGLTCTAFAQNSGATNTPLANLTVIRQNDANFSSDVTVPSFPCDSSSTGLVGGFKPLDLDDINLYYVTRAVVSYFVLATSNITDCDIFVDGAFNITDACSQVRFSELPLLLQHMRRLLHISALPLPFWFPSKCSNVTAGCSGHELCPRGSGHLWLLG